jgi:hypothetical protein
MALKSVLVVSPHFPPINAPDHQRVRMALSHFREFGWEPVVLAVAPEFSENARDDSLAATIPGDIEIHRVRALPVGLTRRFGVGNLALRSLPYLRSKGNELLANHSFDLVFFSTSMFPVMSLGPVWHKRFGVPYVLDFQDPWLTDYYKNSVFKPPGGRIRYALANMLGRALEPRVVREAAHIVVVSPAYPDLLCARYSELSERDFTVLPFAGAESDVQFARASPANHDVFSRDDGFIHWVYAGAAGPIMERSIRAFLAAVELKLEREPELRKRLKIHFVGTAYAGSARVGKTVEPIAAEFDLNGIVEERVDRLPFLVTLKLLADADALMIFGSDDPSYTASKVFPYVLARKPLLVIVHEENSVAEIVSRTRSGVVVTFNSDEPLGDIAARIGSKWCEWPSSDLRTDWNEFDQYSSRSMTRRLSAILDSATSAYPQFGSVVA